MPAPRSVGSDRSTRSGRVRRSPSAETSRASLIQPPPQVQTPPQYLSQDAAEQIASDPDQPYDFIFLESAVARINMFLDQILFSVLDTARSPTFQRINLAAEAFLKSKLYLEAAAAAEQDLADFLDPEDGDDLMLLQERDPSEPFDLEIVFKKSRLRVMSFMRFSDMEGDMELQHLRDERLHSTSDFLPSNNARWSKSRGNQVSELTSLFLCAMLEYITELCIIAAARATVERHDTRSMSSEENSDCEPLDPNVASAFDDEEDREELEITDKDVEKITLDYTVGRLWRSWKTAMRPSRAFTNARRSVQFSRKIADDYTKGRPRSLGHPQSTPVTPHTPVATTPVISRATRSSSLPGEFKSPKSNEVAKAKHRSVPPSYKPSSLLGTVFPKDKLPSSVRRRSFSDIYPNGNQRARLIPIPETKKRSRSMSESSKELEEVRMKFFGLRSSKPATIGPKLNAMRAAQAMKIEIPEHPSQGSITMIHGRGTPAGTPDGRLIDPDSPGDLPSPPQSGSRLSLQQLRQRANRESLRPRASSAKGSQDFGRPSPRSGGFATNLASPAVSGAHERSEYSTPLAENVPMTTDAPNHETAGSLSEKSADRSTTLQTPDTRPSLDDTARSTSPALSSRASTYSTSVKTDHKPSFETKRDARATVEEVAFSKHSLDQQRQPEKIDETDEIDEEDILSPANGRVANNIAALDEESDDDLVEDEKEDALGNLAVAGASAGATAAAAGLAATKAQPPRVFTNVNPYSSRFIEGSPVIESSPESRHFPSASVLAPKKPDSSSPSSTTNSRQTSFRKSIIYVDDSGESRASLRRISGSSQGKKYDHSRARNASNGSLYKAGREGATSRQSQTSSHAHSEIVEREFDDLISAAETQKYTLTPPNLRELDSPASPRIVTNRWPKVIQRVVPSIEEEIHKPMQRAPLEDLPEDYRGPVSSADARSPSEQTRPGLSRQNSDKRSGWVLGDWGSSSSGQKQQARPGPMVKTHAVERVAPPAPVEQRGGPQIRLMGRDPVPDVSHQTRELTDFFNESRLPPTKAPKATEGKGSGNFTPLMPSSPNQPNFGKIQNTRSESEAPHAQGGATVSGSQGGAPSMRTNMQPRDASVHRITNHDFVAALREGPPGASVTPTQQASLNTHGRVIPPNRASSTTTGSYGGSAGDSVSSNSHLLNQPAPSTSAAPKQQSRVRDMYSTDFVDEDDEDALIAMLGPSSGGVTALPQRQDPGESMMDFLKSNPTPPTTEPKRSSHHTSEERRPSRFASFPAFKSNKNGVKKSHVTSEPPQIPMPRGVDVYSARDTRRASANHSGYSTPVPESVRSSTSRPSKQSGSFWRKLTG